MRNPDYNQISRRPSATTARARRVAWWRSRTPATPTGRASRGRATPRPSSTTSGATRGRRIFLTLFDAEGVRIPGSADVRVSNGGSGSSRYPWVVWTGSELGVMYVDTRDGAPALWFQRISRTG